MTGEDTRAYVQDGPEDHVIYVYCYAGLRRAAYAAIDRGVFIDSAETYASRQPDGPGFAFDFATGLTLFAYTARHDLLTTIALRRQDQEGHTVFRSVLTDDQIEGLRSASYIVGQSGEMFVEWSGDGSARRIDSLLPIDGEPC